METNLSSTPIKDRSPLPLLITIAGETVAYHVRGTTAPRAYDGFGTITIYEYDGGELHKADSFRLVLIRVEHLTWQEGRYNSGRYYADKPEEWQYNEAIELLRKRMFDPASYVKEAPHDAS